jgi:hypothetical protein
MVASVCHSSAFFVKTTKEWAALSPRKSAHAAAKKFARENMVATIWLANDDAITYLFDVANNRIAKTVETNIRWL